MQKLRRREKQTNIPSDTPLVRCSIRRQRYKFQPKDEVQVQNKKYEVIGIFNKGSWLRVRDQTKSFNFSINKIEKHYYNNSWQFIPSLKGKGFLAIKG